MNELYLRAFLLSAGTFLLGALAAFCFRRKFTPERAQAFWKKYWVYVAIVNSLGAAILLSERILLCALAAGLVFLALYEVVAATRRFAIPNSRTLVRASFASIAGLFLAFMWTTEPAIILFVFAVVCLFDGFSQVVGQSLGRHQLLPRLSPAKTLEGVLGGLIAAQLPALYLPIPSSHAVPGWELALLISGAAFLGDLSGSAVKRLAELKDFSSLLPAHGGITDRFNSFFMAGAGYFLFHFFPSQEVVAESGSAAVVTVSFLVVLVVITAIFATHRVGVEVSRKLLHLFGGMIGLSFPWLFNGCFWPSLLCALCFVLLLWSKGHPGFASLHAIERDSSGATLFPLAVLGLYLALRAEGGPPIYVYCAALGTLTFADSGAALIGRRFGRSRNGGKTLVGSCAFLLLAAGVNIFVLNVFNSGGTAQGTLLIVGLAVSFVATIVEAVSSRGLDNITVPLSVVLLYSVYLLSYPPVL